LLINYHVIGTPKGALIYIKAADPARPYETTVMRVTGFRPRREQVRHHMTNMSFR
jgi:hypothetical protein